MPLDPVEPLCPVCRERLETVSGQHGVVLSCQSCGGGATTLAVLKRVAPADFVNALWQSARRFGTPSDRICPSCDKPLLDVNVAGREGVGRGEGVEAPKTGGSEEACHIDVCIRCYFVWVGPAAIAAARLSERHPDQAALEARAAASIQAEPSRALRQMKDDLADRVLFALAWIALGSPADHTRRPFA